MPADTQRRRDCRDVEAVLEYFLLAPQTQHLLDRMKTGISDSGLNLTRARFFSLPVVVPPLLEQLQIVALLDGHLSSLQAATAAAELAGKKLRSWEASSVDLMFEAVRERVPLGTLLREPMRNGYSAAASATGNVRILTLTAVTKRQFDESNTKLASADDNRIKDLWLTPGDILVQRSNTPDLVGTSALYSGPSRWAIFPDLMIRVRPDEARVLPGFLAASLASERVHRELRSKAKGLSGSMPKIDQRAIGAQLVPCPTIEIQRDLLRQYDDVQLAASRLTAELDVLRRRQASLKRSLLQAAFCGSLRPPLAPTPSGA